MTALRRRFPTGRRPRFSGATLTFRELQDRAPTGLRRRSARLGHREGRSRRASCCRTVRSTSSRRSPCCGTARSSSTSTRPTRAREIADRRGRLAACASSSRSSARAAASWRSKAQTAIEHVIVTSLAEYSRRGDARAARRRARCAFADLVAGDGRRHPITRVAVASGRRRGAAVHRRHDRHAEGRDADAPEHLRQRRADRDVHRTATRTRGEARYLVVIPYFHIYAFTVGMMKGMWIGALQILDPEVRRRAVLDRDPRLPADLLPRRADDLRVAADPSRRSASTAWTGSASSTAAARPVRSK